MTPTRNMTTGMLLFLGAFVVSVAALYAGALWVDAEEPAAEAGADGTAMVNNTPTIVAQSLQFNMRTLTVGAGAQVQVTLDNRDAGTLHNIAFYTSRAASQVIHKGELFPGPGTRVERFTAPSTPGNFFFRCDAHPDTMTGTFSVR
jgi:plastocyanin